MHQNPQPTAVEAFPVPLEHESDTTALVQLVTEGRLRPDEICAVTGKTEGNRPGENSRAAAIGAVRRFLEEHSDLGADRIARIPMVFSSGGVGILAPHVVVYAKRAWDGPVGPEPRLAIGTAQSAPIRPEWVGHPAMVEHVADAVRAAARDAGIDPSDAEYVLTKSRGLQPEDLEDAQQRGHEISPFEPRLAVPKTSGAAALGVAVAVDHLEMPADGDIGTNLDLWTDRVSSSAGREHRETQVVLLGNTTAAGGRLRVGRSVMTDLLDVDSLHRALRAAGLSVNGAPLAPDQRERIVAVYVKIGTPIGARLRGRRQVHNAENPNYMNELKAAVGGMFAAALQDTVLYISSGAVHQGPPGGGTVAVVVDQGR
ncbi:ring-opening amidohydrolase [Micromonospora sp. CB01531]|uniref:ring-opening amidohydrolase n=1 Tax=Micromonospora sp. CB01531 TaxID=1718947 RepID=UPI00093C6095|nr:ring-opening amidohydrolase [Micromonospora sp. CB01531]OKI51511.1 hypothetical protein A6A27_33425 [Micromonospora sp. CB01531]